MAAGLACVVMAAVPAGASAGITNLELVEADAVEQPSTATCPAGKLVVGAGAGLWQADGEVLMRNIRPRADLTAVDVQGLEDETGAPAGWSAHAYAICATPPPGLERVAVTSASTSDAKTVPVPCPAGKVLLGVGGEIDGGGGQVGVEDMIPGAGLTSVTVTGAEDEDGYTGSWTVTGYAVCSEPVTGLERVVSTSQSTSDDKGQLATCPVGKKLVGMGGSLFGLSGMLLQSVATNGLLTTAGAAGAEDGDGTSNSWSVTAYAICAATAERVQVANTTSNLAKTKTATCPSGMTVTGGGGEISSGGGYIALNELFPNGSAGFRASGDYFRPEPQPPFISTWKLRAYAICTTPLAGRARVSAASAPVTGDEATVVVACPAGKLLVGAGGRIAAGQGDIALTAIEPDPALTSVSVTAQQGETPPLASPWTLHAYAVCATPPRGLELVTAIAHDPLSTPLSVTASCPAGKHLLGAAGTVGQNGGEIVLVAVRPDAGLTGVLATAREDADGGGGDEWDIRAHAICASP